MIDLDLSTRREVSPPAGRVFWRMASFRHCFMDARSTIWAI